MPPAFSLLLSSPDISIMIKIKRKNAYIVAQLGLFIAAASSVTFTIAIPAVTASVPACRTGLDTLHTESA